MIRTKQSGPCVVSEDAGRQPPLSYSDHSHSTQLKSLLIIEHHLDLAILHKTLNMLSLRYKLLTMTLSWSSSPLPSSLSESSSHNLLVFIKHIHSFLCRAFVSDCPRVLPGMFILHCSFKINLCLCVCVCVCVCVCMHVMIHMKRSEYNKIERLNPVLAIGTFMYQGISPAHYLNSLTS